MDCKGVFLWKLSADRLQPGSKKQNKTGFDSAKECFSLSLAQFKDVSLSEEAAKDIKKIEEDINEKYQCFEEEINQAVIEAQEISWDAADKLYGNLICTKARGKARLYTEWHDMRRNNDLAFKNIAKQAKIPYKWACTCFCSKCKEAKNIQIKSP